MSRAGSLVYQVKEALNSIFTPGVSRHELKQRGVQENYIVSFRTMQEYTKACVRFAKWCRSEYGVRHVSDITPQMARAYIRSLTERELSGGHIGRTKAAIRKFDIALRKARIRPRTAPPLLQAGGGWHSDRRPERAYSDQATKKIISDLKQHARDPQVADVVRLQRVAGLRVSEAAMIRGKDIDVDRCTIHVSAATKGGREREVQVDEKYRPFLEHLKERAGQHRDGHVFQGRGDRGASLVRRVSGSVRQACRRLKLEHFGTHGFRKTWAQERYRALRQAGASDREARRKVSQELGHNRLSVTYSYIPK